MPQLSNIQLKWFSGITSGRIFCKHQDNAHDSAFNRTMEAEEKWRLAEELFCCYVLI